MPMAQKTTALLSAPSLAREFMALAPIARRWLSPDPVTSQGPTFALAMGLPPGPGDTPPKWDSFFPLLWLATDLQDGRVIRFEPSS
jgi:hypothetical protein